MANLTAKFKLIDEMSAKLDKIAQSGRNALSQWEQAGNAIDGAFDGAVTSTVQVAQSIGDSSDSIEELNEVTTRAANAAEKLSEANDEAEAALEDVAKDADKAAEKVEDYGEESEDAGRKSEEMGKKSREAFESIEELLVGAGIVKGLEAIGEAFVDCVKDAIEFESAITGVYKTVDGTPEQLAAISDEVKEMSLRLPSTTTEIAAVAEAAGQLGIQTDNITSFTEVMINLGEATNLSSDEAASSLAKFANITAMSADNYENLGSTVVALGNNFATTEADIVAMSMRMASAGSIAGLSEPEILALAAAVSSVGIEADAGGSSMSTLLSKMQLAVETGNDQLEQFASVAGMTADQFSQKWGESAVDALYAFIAGLNDTERNGASATALLDEMGITEIRLSNAVKALASNHEGLANAVDLANNAWEQNTALATEAETRYSTLESKLAMTENAQTNLTTAIGEVFAPTVGELADVWADVMNGMTGFVKQNPTAVKAIAALTAGVATFTIGIVGYTAATKVAKIAQAAFNAVANANPYVLLATAVVAVTVALATFTATMTKAEDELEELTATSRKQAKELEALEAEYEKTAELYGENSYEAWELRQEIDELSASFENSKETAEEFVQRISDSAEKLRESREAYEETSTSLDNESESSMALIAKLQELGSESELAARNQALIVPIIDELNERYEGLGLTFDVLTGKFNMTAEEMQEVAQAEVDIKKREEDWKRYVEIIGEAPTKLKELEEAQAEMNALQEEYNAFQDEINGYWTKNWWKAFLGYTEEFSQLGFDAADVKVKMDELQPSLDALKNEYDEMIKTQKELEEQYGYTADATEESGNGFITYADAVNSSLSSVRTEVEELCKAYDEAYTAARESIDGQIGLFQEMVVEAELTVENMQGAWESQINYLTTYADNIKKAMDFGLDDELIKELSDGSEESAAQLDTIISKVEELGGTTESAKKFVEDFNKKFQEVETAKDEFAGTVADMETGFSEKLTQMQTDLDTAIDGMNMETDAAAAAKATMDAYLQEIIEGGNSAVKAAESAAKRVAAALAQAEADANAADNITYVPRDFVGPLAPGQQYAPYASGTAYASQGVHLVGENGPELVEFEGGETVYPADETSRILARIGDAKFHTSPEAGATAKEIPARDGKEDSKTIRLEINGSGAIEVDGSMDEETVVGILYNHLKPVLTNIVKQEIYEEGELAYDF